MDLPFHQKASSKVFENARFLRKVETSAEKVLWKFLRGRNNNGLKFRRQHPGKSYILDFYCHEILLAIEIDGEIHHVNDNPEYDEGRTLDLKAMGINLIRFTNDEILDRLQEVIEKIKMRMSTLSTN